MEQILGVDVGKVNFHAALLLDEKKSVGKAFPNNPAGFEQLAKWLANRKVQRVHACLEATGGWSESVYRRGRSMLHGRGHLAGYVGSQSGSH